MLQSLALALLTLPGIITVQQILVLQVAQGVINAFDTPARQSFLIDMIEDRADLPNAIALNSSMVNGSRIIGPSIGGIVIAAVGEGWCFMLDAISYLAVIASLLAMRVARTARGGARAALLDDLHGGPHTLGFLMTASGAGALAGALYLASRSSVLGLGRAMVVATLAFGAGLVSFSLSRTLWLSLLILPVVGAGMMVETASTNTILQTIVEERMRGRVMSFYTMAFLGTAPIGSLVAGVLASRIGASATILLGGLACIAGGIWFAIRLPSLRKLLRPIYIARGIISPS